MKQHKIIKAEIVVRLKMLVTAKDHQQKNNNYVQQ